MGELYELERQEARRRAEYEARHAEALRRAEFGVRFDPEHVSPAGWARLSKSATTSPVISPAGSAGATEDIRLSGAPNARGSHGADEYLLRERDVERTRRRLSGPAWTMASAVPHSHLLANPTTRNTGLTHSRSSSHLPVHSHSPGHLVDPTRVSGSAHHGPPWVHPYHPATHHRHRSNGSGLLAAGGHEDSPSPISSDSESVPLYMHTNKMKTPHPHPYQHHRHEHEHPGSHHAHPTPSTSPFLAPFRTLNIHSTNPSRAPSPFLLPPPHLADTTTSGVTILTASPVTGDDSSPSTSSSFPRSGSSGVGPSLHPADRNLPPLPISRGSSPVSFHHPRGSTAGVGTVSTPSSRAPSPLHWSAAAASRPPTTSPSGPVNHHAVHHPNENVGTNHHLTHSLRVAFGMTPIHGPRNSTSSSNTTHPFSPPHSHTHHTHSGTSTPMHFPSMTMTHPISMSMPGSRSGSPPITLPPLKKVLGDINPDGLGNGSEGLGGEKEEKVELPGFSQFEAAAKARGVSFSRF